MAEYSLEFDLSVVAEDAWQTILSTETDTDVNSVKVALYTDTVFSTWKESNSSEDLAEQYSDNVLAMYCSITTYGGFNYSENASNLRDKFCFVGEAVAWGGGFSSTNVVQPLLLDLKADVTAPELGDSALAGWV